MTEQETRNKIEEYKAKCSLLGIEPLNIIVGNDEIIIESLDRQLKTVLIPSFATKLGDSGFYGNDVIISVTIPKSVRVIGKKCFSLCRKLSDVIIQGQVEEINSKAFDGCKKLKNIEIPSSIKYIGYEALSCTEITELNIECSTDKLYIEGKAFYLCWDLATVNIVNKEGSIQFENDTFMNCGSLERVYMEANDKIILDSSIFKDCQEMKELSIKCKDFIIRDQEDFFMDIGNKHPLTIKVNREIIGRVKKLVSDIIKLDGYSNVIVEELESI